MTLKTDMMNGEVTPVIFRVWLPRKDDNGGDVIALFPSVLEANGCCESYQHVGQHGAAHYSHVIGATRRATLDESASLRRELESEPFCYKLAVYSRLPTRLLRQMATRERERNSRFEPRVQRGKETS